MTKIESSIDQQNHGCVRLSQPFNFKEKVILGVDEDAREHQPNQIKVCRTHSCKTFIKLFKKALVKITNFRK